MGSSKLHYSNPVQEVSVPDTTSFIVTIQGFSGLKYSIPCTISDTPKTALEQCVAGYGDRFLLKVKKKQEFLDSSVPLIRHEYVITAFLRKESIVFSMVSIDIVGIDVSTRDEELLTAADQVTVCIYYFKAHLFSLKTNTARRTL